MLHNFEMASIYIYKYEIHLLQPIYFLLPLEFHGDHKTATNMHILRFWRCYHVYDNGLSFISNKIKIHDKLVSHNKSIILLHIGP